MSVWAVVLGTAIAVMAGVVTVVPSGAVIDTAAVVPTPNTATDQDNVLFDVSCVSSSFCVAVGRAQDGATDRTLALVWDGSTWSLQPTPNTASDQDNVLLGVSCVSSSFCVAVGHYIDGAFDRALALEWDGSVWSLRATPVSAPYLSDVSCVSTSFCMAAGYFVDSSLAVMWDGSVWSLQATPGTAPPGGTLSGVSCASATSCVAVGSFPTGLAAQTLAFTWDGSVWSSSSTPNTAPDEENVLADVSCPSPSSCVAVGRFSTAANVRTLALVWDGSVWSSSATPNTAPDEDNDLLGISCRSPSSCVAVGYYYDTPVEQSLAMVWDGSSWSLLTTPSTAPDQDNDLFGVSCGSAWSCIAAGSFSGDDAYRTLVVAFTGPVPPPEPGPQPEPVLPRFTG